MTAAITLAFDAARPARGQTVPPPVDADLPPLPARRWTVLDDDMPENAPQGEPSALKRALDTLQADYVRSQAELAAAAAEIDRLRRDLDDKWPPMRMRIIGAALFVAGLVLGIAL